MAVPIETGSEELLGEIHEGVLALTLNRPERLNALSEGIYVGLSSGLELAANDKAIRVVMLTGAGRAFCAGGDVKGMNERNKSTSGGDTEASISELRDRQNRTVLAMHQLPKPVVAALPGAAAGAGMSIALAADLRIASPRAFLLPAFANVAASGDFGGSWSLTQMVGTAKARQMYFRNERVYADEAMRLGVVSAVLDHDDDDGESFRSAAIAYCQEIAQRAPLALAKMKENLNRALSVDFATALDGEAVNMVSTMATADHREAAAAFVEKRTAVFRGE